jgi:hypothetical protein
VVDGAGRPIMTVEESGGSKGIKVYGSQGQEALVLQSDAGGYGQLRLSGPSGSGSLVMFVGSDGPVFRMGKDAKSFVDFTSQSASFRTPTVRVANLDDDKAFAEMKKDGTSIKAPFRVRDSADVEIAAVQNNADERGVVVYNAQHKYIAQLVADPSGNGVVMARDGKTGNGSGIRFEEGEPAFAMKGSDDKMFFHVERTGSRILGPLTVTDSADKPVMMVSDSFTEQVKDERGQSKDVTTTRGVHVLNAKGQTVARSAVDTDGNGYVIARDSSGKGATAGMIITKSGSQMVLTGTDGKARAAMKSTEGIIVYNPKGIPVGSIGSVSDKGYFELTDAAGNKMVEASSEPEGKGYVLVTPWQVSVAALGDPSVLRGGKKKQ